MSKIVGLLVVWVSLLCFSNGYAIAEKRIALVIGNNLYEHLSENEQLVSAINDARAVKTALESLGFEVMFGENLGRDAFENKMYDFADRISPGDIAMFYYAGHGVNLSGGNYFLPSDIRPPQSTRKGEERRLIRKSIWEQEVISNMKDAGARVSIAVIDACRDNPLTASGGRSLGGSRGLQRSIAGGQNTKGTFSIYSAGYGQQALDRLPKEGSEVNSVFTRVFIKQIVVPGMTLRKLAVNVKGEVSDLVRDVGHEQDPAYYDGIQGKDAVFFSNKVPKPQPKVATKNKKGRITIIPKGDDRIVVGDGPTGPPKEFELALWDSVRNSNDPEAIQAYLDKYPDGVFAPLAKVNLLKLRGIRIQLETDKKRAEWEKIEQSEDPKDIQAFIDANPDSEYLTDAKNRFAALENKKQENVREKIREAERLKDLRKKATEEALAREETIWNSFKDSNDVALLQIYLKTYPNGRFANLAQAKIQALSIVSSQPDIETQLWEAVKDSKSRAAIQAYLDQYPGGKYAALARVQLLILSPQTAPTPTQPQPAPTPAAPRYSSNGCRLASNSGSLSSQAIQIVQFYYSELDQGNASCAIARRTNPSRKLRRLIRNFGGAEVDSASVTYQNGSQASVLTSGRVRARRGRWERFSVQVSLSMSSNGWRITGMRNAR